MTTDNEYMQQAIRFAEKGIYTTTPNPNVGCVIVKDGVVIGEGWHQRAGEHHAEVNALLQAGSSAKDATAYVTLEPCCHTGKTPPCADALIQAGVKKVVVAMQDPNPLVAGAGLKQLADAGVKTSCGLLQSQAEALNKGFIKRMRDGRPYVRLKLGMSLDARTAMASGESQWITGSAARRDVQFLRAESSAVLTGVGTVIADDPSMNVRLEANELNLDGMNNIASKVRQPRRVVLDSQLRTPLSSKILNEKDCWLLTTEETGTGKVASKFDAGIVKSVVSQDGRVDLHAAMRFLAQNDINLLHVEAGAVLSGALLQAKLVDEIVLYIAPVLLGHEARGLFNLPGMQSMKDKVHLSFTDVRTIGEDLRITVKPTYVS